MAPATTTLRLALSRALPTNMSARQYFHLSNLIPQNKSSLFVCAIGVPPKHAVDRLHQACIPVMNMASEGGGHTGDIPSSILIPTCVDAVNGPKSPLTGKPVYVISAGAVHDGWGLAANLMWGAEAVCAVNTRFVAAVEVSAPKKYKELICSAGFEDAVATLIFTGRTPYIKDRNLNCQAEIKELTGKAKLPHEAELEKRPEISLENRPWLMGHVSALINDMLPAQAIVDNMVCDAAVQPQRGDKYFNPKARL
ncbi:hypothetical protein B0H13DRAFT_2651164 [Mycena leptocephala]|nr:hypothetical protein B0H13DRAFT_2651164 [Mycena leptocephala]